MKIRISADSTCDLSPELVEKYDVAILPLYIVKDGVSYADGLEICPQDIYGHVNGGGAMCSTAAVSVADYEAFFTEQRKSCDALIHFHISSEMSSCYQNACIAAENLDNVFSVDSRNLSTGIGQLVIAAAEMISPPSRRASATPRADFPVAVGPVMTRTRFFISGASQKISLSFFIKMQYSS